MMAGIHGKFIYYSFSENTMVSISVTDRFPSAISSYAMEIIIGETSSWTYDHCHRDNENAHNRIHYLDVDMFQKTN